MKRCFVIFVVLAVLFSLCGCSETHAADHGDVTLTFVYGEENIQVILEADEAEKVIDILDGKRYDPVFSGVLSCGFDRDISLSVAGQTFAIACDSCNCVQDLGNLRYFEIPQEDMEYIHALFEKYGGYFPCV